MAENMNTVNSIIVLRNDSTTAWKASSYVLRSGEVGVGYMDRTITNEDGTTTVKKVPIIKVGDNVNTWANLPQAEGVFETNQILTYDFGRHKTSNGYVDAGGAGMTTSEWLMDALSQVKNPTVTYPKLSGASASFVTTGGGTEVGTPITAIKWANTYNDGSYTYGTNTNKTSGSKAGTSAASWSIKMGDTEIGTTEDNTTGYAYSNQVADSAVSVTLTSTATFKPATAGTYIPLNNVGTEVPGLRIAGFDKDGTQTASQTQTATVTGYRNYWYGYVASANKSIANTVVRDGNTVKFNGTALTTSGKAASADYVKGCSATDGLSVTANTVAFVVLVPHSKNLKIASGISFGTVNVAMDDTYFSKYTATKDEEKIMLAGYNNNGDAIEYDILMYYPEDIQALSKVSYKLG